MIKINKRSEPREWTAFRLTSGAEYEAKPYLVDALLEEQGYICAYCERRIPVRDLTGTPGAEDHKVEHVLCREKHPEKEHSMDYQNMVACCPGRCHSGEPHCDTSKGDRDLSFSPVNSDIIDTLSYKNDGEIVSSRDDWNTEINVVLNLNQEFLKENRKYAWLGVIKIINKATPNRKRALIESTLEKYKQRHPFSYKGKPTTAYKEYCGFICYMLERRLKGYIHKC